MRERGRGREGERGYRGILGAWTGCAGRGGGGGISFGTFLGEGCWLATWVCMGPWNSWEGRSGWEFTGRVLGLSLDWKKVLFVISSLLGEEDSAKT